MNKLALILTVTIGLVLGVGESLNSAPKPDYLYWEYNYELTLNDTQYLLRNWKYNRREGIYYAEYTHEGLGHWFNAPFKFDTQIGGTVGSTNSLPQWAENLPNRYDW